MSFGSQFVLVGGRMISEGKVTRYLHTYTSYGEGQFWSSTSLPRTGTPALLLGFSSQCWRSRMSGCSRWKEQYLGPNSYRDSTGGWIQVGLRPVPHEQHK